MKVPLNIEGSNFIIRAAGADEALQKLNLLHEKLKEVNDLIQELSRMEVKVDFGSEDYATACDSE